jgi:MFS family permease
MPYGYEQPDRQEPPEATSAAADATTVHHAKGVMKEDAVRSFSFVAMAVLFAALGFFSGYPQYLTSYGISLGVTATLSSFLLSLSMIGNATSKLVLGYISDRFGGKAMISTSFCMIISSLVLLLIGARFLPPLLVGSLLAGSLYSVSSVASPLLAQTVYGSRDFARIILLLALGQNLFISFGPSIVGYMYDFSGGYSVPFFVGIAVIVSAACLTYVSIKAGKKLVWS